jgi:hypothetical protein
VEFIEYILKMDRIDATAGIGNGYPDLASGIGRVQDLQGHAAF